MDGRLTSAEGLKVGDVVSVAQKLKPRDGGDEYWWKTFRVVMGSRFSGSTGGRFANLLILKLHPDLDKDMREVDFQDPAFVIEYLPDNRHPQGVIAMRMKLIMMGVIKLSDD